MSQIARTASLYGAPQGQVSTAPSHFAGREVSPAQYSGVPYMGQTTCHANGYKCPARKAKGTDYCQGHLNQMNKEEAQREQGRAAGEGS